VRVVFVNHNRSPVYGGVERWMIDTAVGLAGRGFSSVVVGRPRAPWLAAAERAGLRTRGEIHGAWIQRVLRVRAAIRAERPDLIVVKGTKAARWAAWARSTGAGGRVVYFFGSTHELDPRVWIDRHTWRLVDAGIVGAHGAARWYAERGFGPAEKLHLLWRGVDLPRFEAAGAACLAMRAALGLAPDALAVGAVGRLVWEKGIDVLFDAVRLIRPRLPHARFFVVGGGRERPDIEAAAAAPELGGAVTLLGQRDDVPEVLAAMDVVVQSSRKEVMAQTTLEAMAAGKPVVSTRTIGADEAIEDGVSGLLVDVGDAAAIAERVVVLAGDPGRRAALGRAAHARIAAEFTTAHTVDRCEAIFRRIASGR
jgi:glycosyltransferase involved in cell wall biosynthesis